MKKQTAVEWILQQIEDKNGKEFSSYYVEFIEQAKAMEREQIIDAYYYDPNCDEIKDDGEQYYEQTYGGDK